VIRVQMGHQLAINFGPDISLLSDSEIKPLGDGRAFDAARVAFDPERAGTTRNRRRITPPAASSFWRALSWAWISFGSTFANRSNASPKGRSSESLSSLRHQKPFIALAQTPARVFLQPRGNPGMSGVHLTPLANRTDRS
jgi:hypothetical protein